MPALLELDRLRAGYGRIEVLHGVDLAVPAGCVVALLGPNGSGKTTMLRAIAGLLPASGGSIRLGGRRIDRLPAHRVARRGVTMVPEGRGVFPGLTVRDNLELAVRAGPGANTSAGERAAFLDHIVTTFPRLGERYHQLAGSLSGGEQQMLALSRVLVGQPRLLLMDEISMGLAPLVVEQLYESVDGLRARGLSILLVEQYLTYALRLADVCYVLAKGEVVFVGEPAELRAGDVLSDRYLGAGRGR